MSSTFGGIVQAGGALNAARYGLAVVSQNIANADTPGYTRQASQQVAVDGTPGVPTIFASPAGQGGVRVASTDRLNDLVLDARARTEHSRSEYDSATSATLSQLETVFREPSDTGLSEQLTAFWNAWAPVANDPGSAAPRTTLLSAAATAAGTLNDMATTLAGITDATSQSLDQALGEANTAATSLAKINGQIAIATATGANANALLDQRDMLTDKLSRLVGATVTLNPNGSADVVVGGQALVTGSTAVAMGVDAAYQVDVNGTAVTLTGGQAAANVTALTTTIPNYQAQLDTVANALISTANAAQAAGFDLAGNPGQPLFAGSGAAGIAVALTNTDDVAASGTPGGNLDSANAVAAAKLGTAAGGPDSLYTNLVGAVGAQSALAQQQEATQLAVTTSVDALRTSASGVNYDEEVSNMLTYQHAYNAASRVLTTMDSLLDTLINRTGLVGLR